MAPTQDDGPTDDAGGKGDAMARRWQQTEPIPETVPLGTPSAANEFDFDVPEGELTAVVRTWPSIPAAMACGLCRQCRARPDGRGGAVCVVLVPGPG